MKVSRVHPFTGKVNTIELDISESEYRFAQTEMVRGALVQDAFHMLNADEREFLITGLMPGDWDYLFPDERELEQDPHERGLIQAGLLNK